jgi:hypothetical protein
VLDKFIKKYHQKDRAEADWDQKASAAFHTKNSLKFLKTLFVTFCMGDYKSLGAIAALPQWPVRPWD